MTKNKPYIMVRLDRPAIKRKLIALAKADGRSLNSYVERLLAEFVEKKAA